MVPAKAERCTRVACSSVTTSGKYCSAECEAEDKTLEVDCLCKQAGCKAKTESVVSAPPGIPS